MVEPESLHLVGLTQLGKFASSRTEFDVKDASLVDSNQFGNRIEHTKVSPLKQLGITWGIVGLASIEFGMGQLKFHAVSLLICPDRWFKSSCKRIFETTQLFVVAKVGTQGPETGVFFSYLTNGLPVSPSRPLTGTNYSPGLYSCHSEYIPICK